jgi:hypothetical protein
MSTKIITDSSNSLLVENESQAAIGLDHCEHRKAQEQGLSQHFHSTNHRKMVRESPFILFYSAQGSKAKPSLTGVDFPFS